MFRGGSWKVAKGAMAVARGASSGTIYSMGNTTKVAKKMMKKTSQKVSFVKSLYKVGM